MLFNIFLIVGFIYTVHLGLYAVGANIHDIMRFAKKQKQSKTKLPLVTVLIAAYNEEKSIEACLQSVWRSKYPRLEIIVVDDGSKDKTYQIVRDFIAKQDTYKSVTTLTSRNTRGVLARKWQRTTASDYRTVRLLRKANGGKSSALNKALHGGVSGDLVMTLDADSIIDKYAIRRAVVYFDDSQVAGVAANVRVLYRQSVLGLLQQFEHLIGYRSKKFYSLTSSEIIVGGVASTYRKSVLQEVGFYDTDTQTEDIGLSMKIAALGNTEHKLVYAADVLAYTQGVHTFRALMKQRYRWKLGNLQNLIKYSHSFRTTNSKHSRMLTFYRVPMAYLGEVLLLMEPLLLGYVLYLSVLLRSPLMFVGSYVVISAYILLTVWFDEHYSAREKWQMTSYAPVMYFFFYMMDLIQFVAVVKCILHPKQMLLKVKTDGRWVSPERQGIPS